MAAWLDILTDAAGRTLVDTGRLEKLVGDLENPESQSPSLVYFAGGDSRVAALQALFPYNNITRRGQTGFRLSSPSQVIVVLTGSTCASVDMAVETTLCSWQDDPQIETTLVDLRDRQMLSPTARFDPLRRALSTSLHVAQRRWSENGIAFSAAHLYALWERTIQLEVGTAVHSALDCLAIARENHRQTISTEHILSFLTEASPSGTGTEAEAHAFIAAALIMHAYPPRMHSKPLRAWTMPCHYVY
ncbi:hypothetical protein N7470_000573 [Penicillium chermesinum]|nr:hypothetical protein N7470_000573 [Penicillium chermesinum]